MSTVQERKLRQGFEIQSQDYIDSKCHERFRAQAVLSEPESELQDADFAGQRRCNVPSPRGAASLQRSTGACAQAEESTRRPGEGRVQVLPPGR